MKHIFDLPLFFIIVVFIGLAACDSPEKKAELTRITDSIYRVDNIYSHTRDSIEQSNLKISCWEVRQYIDEFGNPSHKKYITNSKHIQGTFSNSATENSKLNVDLLIDNPNSIAIQLYEYGGTNPVKSGIEKGYRIKVKSGNDVFLTLNARNYSDRLELNKTDSKKLIDFLKSTSLIQFSIIELSDYGQASYRFELDNYEGLDSKLSELKNKIILIGY